MDFISSRKIKLMRNLTKIRTTSYALKFCSLLIEAQKTHKEYIAKEKRSDRSSQDCLKYDIQISCEIKQILIHEPAERLVNNIFKALRAPTENLHEKEQQLLILQLNSERVRPAEYLNQLIETLECIMKLFFNKELYHYLYDFALAEKDYEKNLGTLKEFMFFYGKNKVRGLFSRMFWIGISECDYSLEEKKEIGDLMFGAMPYIKTFIKEFSLDIECGIGIIRLQKRSALQFIKDLLVKYSVEYRTLKGLIGTLDEVMKFMDEAAAKCDLPLPSYDEDISVFNYNYETLDDFNDAGANEVPKEHTWWQVYKKANFK